MDTPVNEYFIEKRRMPVELTLLGGDELNGELFIQASARHLSALEDAPEFMNSADPFFPLRLRSGSTLLINKSQVVWVDVPKEFVASADWTYGERARVEVWMEGGSTLEGELIIEHFVTGARVLDHLNHHTEPFVTLQRSTGALLLNRSHIRYIRPVDDAAA